ncbi:hypothetical protein CA13_68150 [Planctomycetes bacterium CA13]|uniref:Uncharacterized protein n=1 Tax=Novipirellula herctigrandis TaxID=2527986 RepID=A0A5C5YN11_9BACT|nr:hypothetical protein CA13_68150 [Planctomycetes bacterium CA13]
MPIGHFFGRHIYLSYTVLVVFGIALGVAVTSSGEAGNQDLLYACLLAIGLWCAGIVMQGIAYCFGLQSRNCSVGLGLIGVRWQAGAMSAVRTLQTSVMTISILVAMVSAFFLSSSYLGDEVIDATIEPMEPGLPFAIPGLEWSSPASMTRFAGWLLLVQLVAQTFPMPDSLGRHLMVSLVAVVRPGASRIAQAMVVHRTLIVISILTAVSAIWVMKNDRALHFSRWPLVMVLAILLARTSRIGQVQSLVDAFPANSPDSDLDELDETENDWRDELPGSQQGHAATDNRPSDSLWPRAKSSVAPRRIRKTMQREHDEAVDAAKLDEILMRLHDNGVDSLSREDREVLKRVSESLRNETQRKNGLSDES